MRAAQPADLQTRTSNPPQSCATVDAAGKVRHDWPPPTSGPTATFSQGLALGVAVHALGHDRRSPSVTTPRIAVLGGGAGVLPAFLHHALPAARIDSVELCPDVCAASRALFGVDALEDGGRFTLHQADALAWIDAAEPASLDVILVDLESGDVGVEARGLIAPPASVLERPFALAAERSLSAGGVLAVNTLGSPELIEVRVRGETELNEEKSGDRGCIAVIGDCHFGTLPCLCPFRRLRQSFVRAHAATRRCHPRTCEAETARRPYSLPGGRPWAGRARGTPSLKKPGAPRQCVASWIGALRLPSSRTRARGWLAGESAQRREWRTSSLFV